MTRHHLIVLAVLSSLLAPSSVLAADETLLSGYGGPGGGEQTLLGTELLPPARGDGSLRAPARPALTATPSRTPRTPRGESSALAAQPARGSDDADGGGAAGGGSSPGSGSAGGEKASASSGSGPPANVPGPSADAAASPVGDGVAYPAEAESGSPLLSGSDVLVALLGLLGVAAIAVLTRRAARVTVPDPRLPSP